MVEYKKCKYDDILNYFLNEVGTVEWLEKEETTSFLALKNKFYAEFFPDMIVTAPKAPTMAEKLAAAKAQIAAEQAEVDKEIAAMEAEATDNRTYDEIVADMNAKNAAAKK